MAIKSNNRCLDLFCMTQGVSRESFISQEYNTFDYPRLFFGIFNQIYRSLFNGSTTSIANPGVIVNIFLGRWTDAGRGFNSLTGVVSGSVIGSLLSIWSTATGEFGNNIVSKNRVTKSEGLKTIFNFNSKECNPYYLLVHCAKDIDFSSEANYNSALKVLNAFEKTYDIVVKDICPKIEKRAMSLGEKNAIKLFKEEEIANDMGKAKHVLETKTEGIDPSLAKKWDELYKKVFEISNKAMKYLASNIDNKMK